MSSKQWPHRDNDDRNIGAKICKKKIFTKQPLCSYEAVYQSPGDYGSNVSTTDGFKVATPVSTTASVNIECSGISSPEIVVRPLLQSPYAERTISLTRRGCRRALMVRNWCRARVRERSGISSCLAKPNQRLSKLCEVLMVEKNLGPLILEDLQWTVTVTAWRITKWTLITLAIYLWMWPNEYVKQILVRCQATMDLDECVMEVTQRTCRSTQSTGYQCKHKTGHNL